MKIDQREEIMMKIFKLIFISLVLISCNSSILDDPSTSINYTVPVKSKVKLTVENSYNTIVATLVDEEQEPGYHNVRFDATNLAEGVYFYTLEMKGINDKSYFKTTRSMLLVK